MIREQRNAFSKGLRCFGFIVKVFQFRQSGCRKA